MLVRENKSLRGDRMMEAAIENGYIMKKIQEDNIRKQKRSEKRSEKRSKKRSDMIIFEFQSEIVKNVYEVIKLNRKAKYAWLADNLGVSEATIKRAISDLKKLGYINPEHSKVNGEWQLLK